MNQDQPTQQQIDDWSSIGRFFVAARALELKIAMRTAKVDFCAHRFSLQKDIEGLEKLKSMISDIADEYLEKVVRSRQAESLGVTDEGSSEIVPE
jgi:hypothetical protein